jgi:hypothetical protein
VLTTAGGKPCRSVIGQAVKVQVKEPVMTQADQPNKLPTDADTRPGDPEKPGKPSADLGREESVPSDGRDVEGEALMKQVRNDKLKNPPPAD